MNRKEKLRTMTFFTKFFSITSYVMSWYTDAREDEVIDGSELMELGAGICSILGLKYTIELTSLVSKMPEKPTQS